ncbi:AEC family transporter [Ramlibacter sp. 2FC]|uniref:AEC family transporter n=1 Tax=Ramlibacter sp. 2FC TaxID=2502188 RepID=UPI0010F8B472|nr:AEC family transporter [Ramlibacter sp. 2FC]
MLDILAITGPIYVAIALGYLTTRMGLFARADMQVMGRFVINLALPALLFNALAQRPIGEILNGAYMGVYLLGSLLTLALGLLWARRGARQDRTTSVYWAMGMACANSGFVGYPVALLTLGPVAGVLLGLNMIVENLLLIPLLLALAESAENRGSRWQAVVGQALRKLLRNPMVLGLVAGFAVSLLGWQLPSPLARTVTLFSQASGALSLFVIGGSLAGLHIEGMGRQVAQIAAGKLLLHPLVMVAVLTGLELAGLVALEPQLRLGLLLTAACPMMGIYTILAQRHGRDGLAAAALLGTTTVSFVTLSAVLWAFKAFGG